MGNPDFRCGACGRQTPRMAASCPTCRSCLLVDVVVDASGLEGRAVYLAAKKIDELGGQAPTFETAKRRLQKTPGVIAEECVRGLAHVIVQILQANDIPARLVPLRRPRRKFIPRFEMPAPIRPFSDRIMTIFNEFSPGVRLAFLALIAVAIISTLMLREPAPEAGVAGSRSNQPAADGGLSNQELVFRSVRACTQIRSDGDRGIAFFISPHLLLTSASNLDARASECEIVHSNGQSTTAAIQRRDPWLDIAVLEVPEAFAHPLELGDATVLERGEEILTIANLQGVEFTASNGIVSLPFRIQTGLAFVEIDTGLGPPGAPVIDRNARVVGIITHRSKESSRLRLATPVNYLYNGASQIPVQPETDAAASKRWRDLALQIANHNRSEIEGARRQLGRPSLISATLNPPEQLTITLMCLDVNSPLGVHATFDIETDGRSRCAISGDFGPWSSIPEHERSPDLQRRLMWLGRNGITAKPYLAITHTNTFGCPSGLRGSQLVLRDGNPRSNRATIDP